MRRKQVYLLSTAAAGAIIGLGGLAHAQTVTLSLKASSGNWSAFASSSIGNNAGLADFDLDVTGQNGIAVSSSSLKAPFGVDTDYGDPDGFTVENSGGVSGIGIHSIQNAGYGNVNDQESDETVIQGLGQVSSGATITDYWNNDPAGTSSNPGPNFTETGNGLWGTTWSAPVLLASGKYTGTLGQLVVSNDPGSSGVQVLNIVSNGVWYGPGNVTTVGVVPVTLQIGSSAPPPSAAIQLFGTAAVGASLGAPVTETGGFPYNLFTATESSPVGSGYLQFTGFHQGDTVDLLLKFGLTNGSGDPASNSGVLSDIINYINANDGSEGTIASVVPSTLTGPNGVSEPTPAGYDILLSAAAPAGDPFADLNFSGFSDSSVGAGTLGVAGLALVPEPASVSLLVLGGLGLMSRRRSRKDENA